MELNKLHVLNRWSRLADQSCTIPSAGVCRGCREVRLARPATGDHGALAPEPVDRAVLETQGDHTAALALLHQQVQGEILHEIIAVVPKTLTIQGMQHGVPCPVSHTAAPVGLSTLPVLVRLATKSPLVDLALRCAGEWHTVVLQLYDSSRGLSGHVVDGVLISQPIRSFDSVVHVPLPVVRFHVAERSIDSTLCSHCV